MWTVGDGMRATILTPHKNHNNLHSIPCASYFSVFLQAESNGAVLVLTA